MTARASSALLSHSVCLVSVELPTATSQQTTNSAFTFLDVPTLCISLRSGDEAAFRFLHEEWNQRIVRYCLALAGGNETVAMDCVQATYLRIFRQMRPLPSEAALWHWIACAARSAASDLHRARSRYRRALDRFTGWLRFGIDRPRESTAESQLFDALDQAVAGLDQAEQFLLEARYSRRQSLEEIARQSGGTVRAIEGRLARIRHRLRQAIAIALRDKGL